MKALLILILLLTPVTVGAVDDILVIKNLMLDMWKEGALYGAGCGLEAATKAVDEMNKTGKVNVSEKDISDCIMNRYKMLEREYK